MIRPFIIFAALAWAPLAQGQPLTLDFLPPEVEARDMCVPSAPRPGTERIGAKTDEAELTDEERIRFLRRDIRNYMAEDADRYFDFVATLIDRRATLDDTFTPVDAIFAKIDLMVRAGRTEQLFSEGLIDALHARRGELTNTQLVELARFYGDGTGVVTDRALSQDLIREAAYGGNATALFEIARLEQAGTLVDGWDAPLDLTVTMAFGGILGAMDQGVCRRASRIAQAYLQGDVVRANPALAMAWFRFAADLGGAEAAWRVVEFHLNAEAATKDNEELRRYLRQAVRLGFTVDDDAASALLASGAVEAQELEDLLGFNYSQDGRRTRIAIPDLLQLDVVRPDKEVSEDSPYNIYLRELAALPTAPGRVFDQLAVEVLLRKGRWAGEAEALALLEEGTRRGDERAQRRLAGMLVRYRDDATTIARVDTLLADLIARFGTEAAMHDLDTLYRCQVNDAPRLDRAEPWAAAYRATGHGGIQISAPDLLALSPDRDPETLALIQSMALDRRVAMMAAHTQRVQSSGLPSQSAARYWAAAINRSHQALEEFAELEFDLATSPTERDLAVELMRRVALHNGVTTALELGMTLVEYNGRAPDIADQIEAQLTLAGNRGEGAAIRLLSRLQTNTRSEAEVFAQFADIIDARGDFLALMFAMPHVTPAKVDDYIDRAVSLMNCGTKDAAELADAYTIHNDAALAFHWQRIGLTFEGGHVLSKLRLSNSQVAYFDEGSAPDPVAQASRDLTEGDPAALLRLVQLTANPDLPTYDADAAIEHFLAAVQRSDEQGTAQLAALYRAADPAVRTGVDRRIDIAAVLTRAAQVGDAASAFELGMLLRDRAVTGADLGMSLNWLEVAAKQGHRDAMFEAAYAHGLGLGGASDADAAQDWLAQAETAGHPDAAAFARMLSLREEP